MPLFNRSSKNSRLTVCLLKALGGMLAVGALSQCTFTPKGDVVVSVKDQKLGIYSEGKLRKQFVISTSKFGLGDQKGSNRTPLGKHEIIAKIGQGLPAGAVLKSRRWNGEVLKPNTPGRDPIVSRILWLRGMETSNRNAFNRFIYIHGTPEENRLGTPASYGCVRMGMKDVVDLFNTVNVGAKVVITKDHLPRDEPDKANGGNGSPALVIPGTDTAEPLEIARLVPTEGEKTRAQENEAKARKGLFDRAAPKTESASNSVPGTKLDGQDSSTKSKRA